MVTFDGIGRWLVHDLGWISLELLILTGAVYVVTRWGGIRSSRVRRWLWTLAVVKPLATVLVAWPLPAVVSRAPGLHAIIPAEPTLAVNVPSLRDAIPVSPIAGGGSPGPVGATPTTTPDVAATPPTQDASAPALTGASSTTGFAVLGGLWLIGCAALGAYTLAGVWWLLRVRREAIPLDAADLLEATEQHEDEIAELLTRVKVRLTTRIVEPCIYGFFQPVILLPAWCLDESDPPNLEYILLHEGMHCRARDHWFLWARRVTEVFLWFHPAVWYAGQKAMAEAENVCDEAVVALAHRAGTPSPSLLYSSCLMRVLERATRHAFEGLVPGVMPTAERIRRLVQQTAPVATSVSGRATLSVIALGALALPGAFSGSSAVSTHAYRAVTHEEPPVREILYASRYPGDYFRNLYIMRSDGTRPMRLTDDKAYYMESDWSPDGSLIAAVSLQPGSRGWRAWMHSADGQVLHPLGDPDLGLDRPVWMADGSALVAIGRAVAGEPRGIYLADPSGPILRRVTNDSVDWAVAAPSPDGATIAAVGLREGVAGHELVLMDMQGVVTARVAGAGPEGIRTIRPAWSPDGSQVAYLVASEARDGPDELRVMAIDTLQPTVLGELQSHFSERKQRMDWYPDDNALLVVDRGPGDTRYHLYRLDLDDGSMTRLAPRFAESIMPSIGPIASPDRKGGDLVAPPFVEGPATDPATGHVYYAVFTERRISWVEADAEAGEMRHEGRPGNLACVTSEREGRFLQSAFPRTHHGFWLGGYAPLSVEPQAPYEWSWASGEPWDYTSWQDDADLGRDDWAAAAVMTWSLRARVPERAGEEDHYMWATQDPAWRELGFIVEFDAASVSSADASAPPGS
jgi:beta-lactamase regulating signal transducer with metallopeptidase domain